MKCCRSSAKEQDFGENGHRATKVGNNILGVGGGILLGREHYHKGVLLN